MLDKNEIPHVRILEQPKWNTYVLRIGLYLWYIFATIEEREVISDPFIFSPAPAFFNYM